MTKRLGKLLALAAVATGLLGASAVAAGPSGPTTRSGQSAQVVAQGVATPTAFAFGGGTVFMSDGTPPSAAPVGGVYVLKHGTAIKLPGSPAFSFGVAWHKGTLYVSAINQLMAWSGWNGTTFATKKVIYTAPKGFPAFNGLAVGPDGRLYVGVDVGEGNDHGPAKAPYQYDVLSLTTKGTGLKVVAKGIRQPWQFAFAPGSKSPYVSALGQDSGASNPPDAVLRVKAGQNYGFPKCNWTKSAACQKYAKPFQLFGAHTDPMGLAIVGKRLYISEFGGAGPAQVVSIPLGGGKPRVELSGFDKGRNVVGLGQSHGWVYVGEVAASSTVLGTVYKFKAS